MQSNSIDELLFSIYESLRKEKREIKFFCAIKKKMCVALHDLCADCPLLKFQTK